MKRFLVAAFLALCIGRCEAGQMDVQVVMGSGTYSGVWVSSGVAMRVDNRVRGSTITVPSTRIGIEVQNLDSTYNVWCAYDTSFTTSTTTQALGNQVAKKINPGSVVFVGALRQATYNCQAEDAAGGSVWIHTEQVYKE